jgi:hypothetical protein
MDVHPFLLIGVYLERVFAFAPKYWTHLLFLLGANIQNLFQNNSNFKIKNGNYRAIKFKSKRKTVVFGIPLAYNKPRIAED